MADGTEEIGTPGDYLFIQPGHRAWVLGDETCVLIDW
jgi:quercetin dioxygenase-like cupin family protein